MANDREYGYNTILNVKKEAAYAGGGSGNFVTVPFDSCGLRAARNNISHRRAGAGREQQEIFQDAISCAGPVIVPVDPRYFGYWLTLLLGDPTTADDEGVYTHTFKSGGASLPSWEVEKGFPSVPKYEPFVGIKASSMEITVPRAGPAQATFNLIGSDMTPATSSGAGTPTTQTLARFSNLQAKVQKGGSDLANLNPGSRFVFDNGLVLGETLNQDNGALEYADPGEASMSGQLSLRFFDDPEYDAAVAGTPIDIAFIYTISASLKLTMTLHEIYLTQTSPEINGPGGVVADFEFTGNKNTSAGCMLTAALVNDLAGTTYTSGP